MKFESEINGEIFHLDLNSEAGLVTGGSGEEISFQIIHRERDRMLLRTGTKVWRVDNIRKDGSEIQFSLNGQYCTARVQNENDLLLKELGISSGESNTTSDILAPMPGKVLDILVKEGDDIDIGEPVLILEAMKMENELLSGCSGRVRSIQISVGDSVEKNQLLIEVKSRG